VKKKRFLGNLKWLFPSYIERDWSTAEPKPQLQERDKGIVLQDQSYYCKRGSRLQHYKTEVTIAGEGRGYSITGPNYSYKEGWVRYEVNKVARLRTLTWWMEGGLSLSQKVLVVSIWFGSIIEEKLDRIFPSKRIFALDESLHLVSLIFTFMFW